MRKIFIILTLIVSSFFVFNTNVKAATVEYTIKDTQYQFINDDFFKLRELVINYVNENNKYYVIYNDYYGSSLQVSIFDCSYLKMSNYNLFNSCGHTKYKLSNDKLSLVQSGSGTSFSSQYTNLSAYFSYAFMDTNVEDISSEDTNTYIIKYNDLTYTIEPGDILPTLYQIYLDENYVEPEPEPEDPHLEEKEILSNFYTTVITKIGELANNVFNNYILLFSIGIFIFIFVFEIIFRRLL